MWNSTSETPENSNHELLLRSFRNLELGNDGIQREGFASVAQTPKNEQVTNERRSDGSPSPSIPDNMWAYQRHGGDILNQYSGQGSCNGSMNYANMYNFGCARDNFSVNSRTTKNSCYGGLSPSNSMNSCYDPARLGDYVMNNNSFANHQFNETGSNQHYRSIQESSADSGNQHVGEWRSRERERELISLLSQQPGNNIMTMAKRPRDSRYLQEIVRSGNHVLINLILDEVLNSIYELMTDRYGHHLFFRLIEACNDNSDSLRVILSKVVSERKSLFDTAFNRPGSKAIQKLIKHLKKSSMAITLTSVLATGLYDLMTHAIGRHVINQCFVVLDVHQNKVLYGEVINHCIKLATHQVGCVSLNECINSIAGSQRDTLLNVISSHSVFLSQDPSGNYVMQNVIELQNPIFTDKICSSLQGHYTRLSTLKNGSHVVEKCMKSSDMGMTCVAKELLESGEVEKLARHQFGNYVIQTALQKTKRDNIDLYESLASALRPHYENMEGHVFAKNVVKCIRDC